MYEKLIKRAEEEGLEVVEVDFSDGLNGLYYDGAIAINRNISNVEKACVICEELGHYHTTHGNILDQSQLSNRKQELLARAWGYKKLVGILDLINAYNEGVRNRYELAECLGVTEEFLEECIKYYKQKYGQSYQIDNYVIYFEPLGVLEIFF